MTLRVKRYVCFANAIFLPAAKAILKASLSADDHRLGIPLRQSIHARFKIPKPCHHLLSVRGFRFAEDFRFAALKIHFERKELLAFFRFAQNGGEGAHERGDRRADDILPERRGVRVPDRFYTNRFIRCGK